jgi:prophage DNA circulation protein
MSLFLDSLLPASFKGVPFNAVEDSTQDGRRIAVHRFVSKNDEPEDLGRDLPVHNITAVIKGFNVFQDSQSLTDALNSPGPGLLIHPLLGNLNCVCLSFTKDYSNRAAGKIVFAMQFKEVKDSIYPSPTKDVKTVIANFYKEIYSSLGTILNLYYKISNVLNVDFLAHKMKELADILAQDAKTFSGAFVTTPEVDQHIKTFDKDAYKNVASPDIIGDKIGGVIGAVDNISTDGQLRFNVADNLFGFGLDDTFLDLNTASIIERNNDAKLLNGAINALFIVNKIDAAKLIEYTNSDQIERIENSINKSYYELVNSSNAFIPDELLTQLSNLRVQAKSFFNDERAHVSKVVTITTNSIPLAVLVYQYYGSLDNFDIILDLNNIYNPGRVSGEIKILEAN